MFAALPALITGGAAVLGGLLGSKSQEDTNEKNLEIAREQMAFNANQSDINRDWSSYQAWVNREFQSDQAAAQRNWSEAMSASSYQRAVGDLEKAGLNPMLAYSQGGAPMPTANAPSGSLASSSPASYSSLPQRQAAAVAGMNAAAAASQVQNLQKTGVNIDADTQLKREQASREAASAEQLRYGTQHKLPAEVSKLKEEVQLVMKQGWNETDRGNLMRVQILLSEVDNKLRSYQIHNVDAQTALHKVEQRLKTLQLPEAEAFSEKFKGDWGKYTSPYIKEVLDILRMLVLGRTVTNR